MRVTIGDDGLAEMGYTEMSEEQQSQDVDVRRRTPAEQVEGAGRFLAHYRADLQQVLPVSMSVDDFARLAVGVLRTNEELAECAKANPMSFLSALMECAKLGHSPGTKHYALVPLPNGKNGPEVLGVEQYQGVVKRMNNAGVSPVAEVIRENDRFSWRPGQLPEHDADWLADETSRGPLRGVYAYALLPEPSGRTRLSRVVLMGKAEVMKHKAVARSKKFWEGPFEKSMWLKTAVHELEKWVPASAVPLNLEQQAEAASDAD